MMLNLGCGHHPLPDWTNVDLYSEQADIRADIVTAKFSHVVRINAEHVLEHLARADVRPALTNWHSWCVPGARLYVEVPDMEVIARMWDDPWWAQWTYGSQEHEGEFHRCGFSKLILARALTSTGWDVTKVEAFRSVNPERPDMPCLGALAVA